MQLRRGVTQWGLLLSDRSLRVIISSRRIKRFAWSTALRCGLTAPPDLLRQTRPGLWLRNHFPGRYMSLDYLRPRRLLPDVGFSAVPNCLEGRALNQRSEGLSVKSDAAMHSLDLGHYSHCATGPFEFAARGERLFPSGAPVPRDEVYSVYSQFPLECPVVVASAQTRRPQGPSRRRLGTHSRGNCGRAGRRGRARHGDGRTTFLGGLRGRGARFCRFFGRG